MVLHGYVKDDRNDDLCFLCGEVGDLVCCDHCPKAFHLSCAKLDAVPEGEWSCGHCKSQQPKRIKKPAAVAGTEWERSLPQWLKEAKKK